MVITPTMAILKGIAGSLRYRIASECLRTLGYQLSTVSIVTGGSEFLQLIDVAM